MTEPIKLPPDVVTSRLVMEGINKHVGRDIEQWVNEQLRLAVEQNNAELRAKVRDADWAYDSAAKRADKMEQERDELRAEVEREGKMRVQAVEGLLRVINRAEKAEAEAERLLEALSQAALVAHSGGLASMSQADVLTAVRRITLPYWDRSMPPEKVRTALARKETT